MFATQDGIGGEARIVERAFGIGSCALTEAMALLQDHLATADSYGDTLVLPDHITPSPSLQKSPYVESMRAVNANGPGKWSGGPDMTTSGTATATEVIPLTGAFEDVLATHDGSAVHGDRGPGDGGRERGRSE